MGPEGVMAGNQGRSPFIFAVHYCKVRVHVSPEWSVSDCFVSVRCGTERLDKGLVFFGWLGYSSPRPLTGQAGILTAVQFIEH